METEETDLVFLYSLISKESIRTSSFYGNRGLVREG